MTNETQELSNESSSSGVPATERQHSTKGRVVVASALIVLVLIVAAVWKASDGGDSTTPTTAPQTTETTLSAEGQKVLADYRAFWDAYITASNPMRPDHPDLAAHSTGEEYRLLVESFSAMKSGDEVIKGDYDLAPKFDGIVGGVATVRDCIDDRTGVYDVNTGERKDEDDPRRRAAKVTMDLVDGTWKVRVLTSEGFGCTP
jgi:hypothetical protein